MALGDPYVTLDELKTYLKNAKLAPGVSNSDLDPILNSAIQAASDEIETYCGRQFNKETLATAREYTPLSCWTVLVDDFWTTDGLIVQTDDGSGTYSTTLTSSEYFLEPKNGVVNGQSGWPYCRIVLRPLSGRLFFRTDYSVRVTAKWGWNAVPDSVKTACYLMSHDNFKLKDTPFGVAGQTEFGVIRVRNNPMIEAKLKRFRRFKMLGG